jgi:hypothetical protein
VELTFKKSFGLDVMPADIAFWMFELGQDKYAFRVRDIQVKVGVGRFGRAAKEAHAIDRFLSASNRPFRGEIITFDVMLDIPNQLPEALLTRADEHGAADEIVRPHITTAFHAVRVFIETYRDCKYVKHRGTDRWTERKIVLPHITEQEFTSFLFYVLVAPSGETFVGAFSAGTILMSEVTGQEFATVLQAALQNDVPLNRKFIEVAWEYFFDEDFAGAVLYAAICIERAMSHVLRKILMDKHAGTASQIDRAIDDTSNRLLCTVMLGMLGIGDSALRERLAEVFEIRNGIAHGRRAIVQRDMARSSLDAAESFLTILSSAS